MPTDSFFRLQVFFNLFSQFFRIGLTSNGLESDPRINFLSGDSRNLGLLDGPDCGQLRKRATRISLGLIPSSRQGWRAAARMVSSEGTILHVHGLQRKSFKVSSLNCELADEVRDSLNRLLSEEQPEVNWAVNVIHIQKVKSYCPSHDHLVVDVQCLDKEKSLHFLSK